MRKSGLFGLAAALLLAACNPFAAGNVTQDAVDAFHTRFNYRMFSEIYTESDYTLRRETEYRDFNTFLQGLRQALGEVVSTERKEIEFQKSGNGPDKAIVLMETTFEYGTAEESFVFSLGQQVKLVSYGYQITHHDVEKRRAAQAEAMREQIERIGSQRAPQPVRTSKPLTEEEIRQLPPEIREALREAGAI